MFQDWVAGHLGHDIQVHRQYYRRQDASIELGVIPKLLWASDLGQIHEKRGHSLESINNQPNRIAEAFNSSSDSEEEQEEDSGPRAGKATLGNKAGAEPKGETWLTPCYCRMRIWSNMHNIFICPRVF